MSGSRGIRRTRRRIGVLTALVAAAAAFIGLPAVLPSDPVSAAAPAPDSLSRLDPFEAYAQGRALGEAQRFDESLPYFRRALEVPTDAWQPYCDYAISLFQTTHQVREHRGGKRPVTRSSYERVALMREALRELDRAEQRAGTPSDRGFVIASRARYLKVWGLPWDALSEYYRAGSLEPARMNEAFGLMELMQHPTRPAPGARASPAKADTRDGE